ncbi:MAG: NUDIX hydrolase [Ktedonobacteraceae bacterium]
MMEPGHNMITFTRGNTKFSYRIAGVAISDGYVLLQRAEESTEWFVPGGRAELLETAQDGLRREMQEELHSDIRIERLLYVIENFFSIGDLAYHELGLYFSISFADESMYDKQRTFLVQDANMPFIFQWIPLHTLENIRVYPLCLQKTLQSISETTRHIVHFDG